MAQHMDELRAITLHPKFIHKYGDRPYFAQGINAVVDQGVFIKYKVSESEYAWARVREVMDSEENSVFTWNKKRFRMKFAVEADDNRTDAAAPLVIGCEAISAKPLDQADVRRYLIRKAGGGRTTPNITTAASTTSPDTDPAADGSQVVADVVDDEDIEVNYSVLPSAEVCTNVAAAIDRTITHRSFSDIDVAAMTEYQTKLGGFAGNLAVRHTATILANMRDDTEIGHATSYHQTGLSGKAQLRRVADRYVEQQQQQQQDSLSQTNNGSSGAPTTPGLGGTSTFTFEATQSFALSQRTSSYIGEGGSPIPISPSSQPQRSSSSIALSARFLEAQQNEQQFHEYISAPDRSRFITLLANKTRENAEVNARMTVKAMSQGNIRKSNMIESTGLWITDDVNRLHTAESFAAAKNTADGGEEKKGEKKSAPAAAAAAANSSKAATSTPTATSLPTTPSLKDIFLDAVSSSNENVDSWLTSHDNDSSTSASSTFASSESRSPSAPQRAPDAHTVVNQLILAKNVSPQSQLVFLAAAATGGSRKRIRSSD